MRTIFPLFLIFFFFVFSAFEIPNSSDDQGISFHQVDLVCGAATDIGCGSRSKPILIDLEKEPNIREAWLNRPGTIVAVVWQEGNDTDIANVKKVFKKHRLSIKTLEGDGYEEQVNNFKNEKWYRGAEVDELSIEEAGRIADKVIDPLLDADFLSEKDAPAMHAEIEEYIKNEFLTLEDVSLLSKRAYYVNWEKEIQKIASGYIAEENIPKIKIVAPSIWRRVVTYGSIAVVLFGVVLYRRKRNESKQ